MQTTITFTNKNPNTIANKLAVKLGREPSNTELKEETLRILRSL